MPLSQNGNSVSALVRAHLRTLDARVFGHALHRLAFHLRRKKLAANFAYKFIVYHQKDDGDLVSHLCDKYGSDKGEIEARDFPYAGPKHTYAGFYSRLYAHCRQSVKSVFECGIGTNRPNIASSMGVRGRPGASLRVWRDFFPNAAILGADIDRSILFAEERIRTFHIDQLDPSAIAAFWAEAGATDLDLIVDDGLHTFEAGICLFEHSVSKLSQDGIYIIEDVEFKDLDRYVEFFSDKPYKVDYVNLYRPKVVVGNNSLIVIRKPFLVRRP